MHIHIYISSTSSSSSSFLSANKQQVVSLPSPRFSFVCWYVAASGLCYYNTVLCCDYFSSSSVISRAFSALCMYSKFGHHPHPLGYLCAKFHFFCDHHCWASPWRKTASLNHSPSLFDAPGTKVLALQNTVVHLNNKIGTLPEQTVVKHINPYFLWTDIYIHRIRSLQKTEQKQ